MVLIFLAGTHSLIVSGFMSNGEGGDAVPPEYITDINIFKDPTDSLS